MPVTDFRRIYELLTGAGVHFILIGGGAATLHGSPRLTLDVDVVYERTIENMRKLAEGGGRYGELLPDAFEITALGVKLRCVSLAGTMPHLPVSFTRPVSLRYAHRR